MTVLEIVTPAERLLAECRTKTIGCADQAESIVRILRSAVETMNGFADIAARHGVTLDRVDLPDLEGFLDQVRAARRRAIGPTKLVRR